MLRKRMGLKRRFEPPPNRDGVPLRHPVPIVVGGGVLDAPHAENTSEKEKKIPLVGIRRPAAGGATRHFTPDFHTKDNRRGWREM